MGNKLIINPQKKNNKSNKIFKKENENYGYKEKKTTKILKNLKMKISNTII